MGHVDVSGPLITRWNGVGVGMWNGAEVPLRQRQPSPLSRSRTSPKSVGQPIPHLFVILESCSIFKNHWLLVVFVGQVQLQRSAELYQTLDKIFSCFLLFGTIL